ALVQFFQRLLTIGIFLTTLAVFTGAGTQMYTGCQQSAFHRGDGGTALMRFREIHTECQWIWQRENLRQRAIEIPVDRQEFITGHEGEVIAPTGSSNGSQMPVAELAMRF